MKERKSRPIIFTGDSIPAILKGIKTQTSRPIKSLRKNLLPGIINSNWTIVKPHPGGGWCATDGDPDSIPMTKKGFNCRYGAKGDLLWVKEAWFGKGGKIYYEADEVIGVTVPENVKWRPPLLMPRWVSRIDLENLSIMPRRLKSYTEVDAQREGYRTLREFLRRWDEMWKKKGFGVEMNPWVWSIRFKPFEQETL
jgi:hypothetical protein